MSFDTGFDDAFDAPAQDETTALLIRARGFIERGWCKGIHACDGCDIGVDPSSDHAAAWSMVGALLVAGIETPLLDTHPAVKRLYSVVGQALIPFNNSQKTVEPVLAAFDRAIAATGSGP